MKHRERADQKPKVIAVIGPTGSGKTALAIRLAKRFRGEIISADSRQVYRGCDIGTEKISKRERQGIPHHLLDVANPKRPYSVTQFVHDAEKALSISIGNGHVPIVVGGTGLYSDALLTGEQFPEVPPDTKLRARLAKKTPAELFALLRTLDPKRAKTIDQKNPRRLERAIEIATALGKVPARKIQPIPYDILWIGLHPTETVLRKHLSTRLARAIKRGLIAETERLRAEGVSWKRLSELGLEYRLAGMFLQGKLSRSEMLQQMERELWHYTKRQMTWFKRNKDIAWFSPKEERRILSAARIFLT